MGTRIDQKTAMGTFGSVLATIIATLLTATGAIPESWSPEDVALIAGAAAVIATGFLAYRFPNELSPQLGIDPKAFASTAGAALAAVVWFIAAKTVDPISDLDPETIASMVGATATALAYVLGYWTRNGASPIKGDGVASTDIDPDELAAHETIIEGGGS